MKDTVHYQIGQNIGDFTISSYLQNEGLYVLTCKCGNTAKGASDHVTRKIANLLSEGYSACQQCTFNYQEALKKTRNNNDMLYTYKDVYREYVKKSKARNIDFSLSMQEASNLFSQDCFYCKCSPSNKRSRLNGNEIYYQGIDRVDNSIGYEITNVVPCCKYCNSSKLDRTQEEFYKHIKSIYFNKVQRSASQEA